MVELIDWMRMRISELHSTIGRRRGRRRTNVTLETFIAHLARVALALGKEVTRPTHADQPERNSFFRFVDKAVAFGCMAAKEALQQAGGIPEASRAKVIKDLDRMMALRDRGLSDAIRKGLARLPADATKSRRKIRCRTRDFSA